jgi:hypothetical protein
MRRVLDRLYRVMSWEALNSIDQSVASGVECRESFPLVSVGEQKLGKNCSLNEDVNGC